MDLVKKIGYANRLFYSVCYSLLKYDFLSWRSAVALTGQAREVPGACGRRQRGLGKEAATAAGQIRLRFQQGPEPELPHQAPPTF